MFREYVSHLRGCKFVFSYIDLLDLDKLYISTTDARRKKQKLTRSD